MGEIQSLPLKPLKKTQKIQNYKILHKIGKGSFGSVYKVKNLQNNENYAIKIQNKGTNPYASEDTKKEVEFLKQTKEIKETINLIETFEDEENTYIVEELCEEGSLEDYIFDFGPLQRKIALDLFEQIVTGVKKLHDLGIIHRDLKPLNILLTIKKENNGFLRSSKRSLQAKIIDFGLSKKTEIFYSTSGTKEFAAPEYFNSYYDALKDNTIDVWALGCILFYVVTGKKAFYGVKEEEGIGELFLNVEDLKRGDLGLEGLGVDLDVCRIIRLCCKVDAKERIDAGSLLEVRRFL